MHDFSAEKIVESTQKAFNQTLERFSHKFSGLAAMHTDEISLISAATYAVSQPQDI